MTQKTDSYLKIGLTVASFFILYIFTVSSGVYLGVGEEWRMALVIGGLFVSIIFAAFTWANRLSLIGIASFLISLWAGNFAELTPEATVFISVLACILTAIFLTMIGAFRD